MYVPLRCIVYEFVVVYCIFSIYWCTGQPVCRASYWTALTRARPISSGSQSIGEQCWHSGTRCTWTASGDCWMCSGRPRVSSVVTRRTGRYSTATASWSTASMTTTPRFEKIAPGASGFVPVYHSVSQKYLRKHSRYEIKILRIGKVWLEFDAHISKQ